MGPFIKDNNSIKKININTSICLLILIIFNFYKNGYLPYKQTNDIFMLLYPIIIPLIATITMFITNFIYKKISKNEIEKGISITSILVFSILISVNTPIYLVIIGSLLITLISKFINEKFKFIDLSLIISLIVIMINYLLGNSYLNITENSLLNISNINSIGNYDTLIKPFGNLTDFLIGFIPGIGVSSLICLLSLIYLSFTKAIKFKISVIYLLVIFLMTYYIGSINGLGIWYPLYNIFSLGTLFGAVFLVGANNTTPITPIGQILYAILTGILVVILRYLNIQECVLISILIMNFFVLLLDKVGYKARFNFSKCLVFFIIIWIILLGFSIFMTKNAKDNKINNIEINEQK